MGTKVHLHVRRVQHSITLPHGNLRYWTILERGNWARSPPTIRGTPARSTRHVGSGLGIAGRGHDHPPARAATREGRPRIIRMSGVDRPAPRAYPDAVTP